MQVELHQGSALSPFLFRESAKRQQDFWTRGRKLVRYDFSMCKTESKGLQYDGETHAGVWSRDVKLQYQESRLTCVFTTHRWPLLKLVWQIRLRSLLLLLRIDNITPLPWRVHFHCSLDYFTTLKTHQTKKGIGKRQEKGCGQGLLMCDIYIFNIIVVSAVMFKHCHISYIGGFIKTLHTMQISTEDSEIERNKATNLQRKCFKLTAFKEDSSVYL